MKKIINWKPLLVSMMMLMFFVPFFMNNQVYADTEVRGKIDGTTVIGETNDLVSVDLTFIIENSSSQFGNIVGACGGTISFDNTKLEFVSFEGHGDFFEVHPKADSTSSEVKFTYGAWKNAPVLSLTFRVKPGSYTQAEELGNLQLSFNQTKDGKVEFGDANADFYEHQYTYNAPEIYYQSLPNTTTYHNVIYYFVSGTEGKELPEEINDLLPENQVGVADGSVVVPITLNYTSVEMNDGTWTFSGWDAETKVIEGNDLNFEGKWIFTGTGKDENITNDEAPTINDVPATGDTTNKVLLGMMMITSIGVIGFKKFVKNN